MVYVFLADGFEDIEALAPIDLLRRAGVQVKTVGVTGQTVESSHGVKMQADATEAEMNTDVEMIILPGGGLGTENLDASPMVDDAIAFCRQNGIPMAAICAAPSVLGKRGILSGKKATCFPGFEEYLEGAEYVTDGVCRDGDIITAKSAGHCVQFGISIVEFLRGSETAEKLRFSLYQQ